MQQPDSTPQPISIGEFFPILMASEIKLELINGRIVPFANGTAAHGLVCDRIVRALRKAAQPECALLTSDIALRCGSATYVFPDACYTCETRGADADSILAPKLIVEVNSPESAERDRVDKLDLYQAIHSVQEYLIVDSQEIGAGVYRRHGRDWIHTTYRNGDTIELPSIENTRIKLAELYGEPGN
jgi:Uma2 family endonuclease